MQRVGTACEGLQWCDSACGGIGSDVGNFPFKVREEHSESVPGRPTLVAPYYAVASTSSPETRKSTRTCTNLSGRLERDDS